MTDYAAPEPMYLFVFSVDPKTGAQTLVHKEFKNTSLDNDALASWKTDITANLPCGTYQFDAVTLTGIREAFNGDETLSRAELAKWQNSQVGDVASEELAGTVWNDHATIETCAPPPPPPVTTTEPVPVATTVPPPPPVATTEPPPLVPVPTIPAPTYRGCYQDEAGRWQFESADYHGFARAQDNCVAAGTSRELAVTGLPIDPTSLLLLVMIVALLGSSLIMVSRKLLDKVL